MARRKAWSAKPVKVKRTKTPPPEAKEYSAKVRKTKQVKTYGKKANPQVLAAEAKKLHDQDLRSGKGTNYGKGKYELDDEGRPYIPPPE
jgi:hypothetical protein